MNNAEKIAMLKTMTDETDEGILSTYLTIAGDKILRRMYPYDDAHDKVPSRYEMVQLQVASYLVNKRGAEGETAHSENGIARSYEDADVPASLLREVMPVATVIGGGPCGH